MKIKNLILGIGIFIVFMFFMHYGIKAFYEGPEYEDYCNSSRFMEPYPYKVDCNMSQALRDEVAQCQNDQGIVVYQYDNNSCPSGIRLCDYCQKDFNAVNDKYNRNVFIIAIIIGLITLVIGFFILSVEPVGSALIASGIGAFVYGSIRNWQNFGNTIRFILLAIALAFLIWLALRLNRR